MLFSNLYDFPEDPTKRIDDYPLLGRFIKDATPRNTKYITRFYEMAEESDRLVKTINHYRKLGEHDKANELAKKKQWLRGSREIVNALRRIMRNTNQRIRMIHYRKDLSAEEKRDRINALLKRRNEQVKRRYDILLGRKKAVNE